VTIDTLDEKTFATGPGEINMVSPNNGDAAPPGPGAAPAETLRLTHIYYDGRVFNNRKDNVARVYDNVRVLHFSGNKPNATMNPDRLPKDGFYLKCEELTTYTRDQGAGQVSRIFSARKRVEFNTD